MKILITGATGNVGSEVIKAFQKRPHQLQLLAGVRNPEEDKEKLAAYKIQLIKFDFTDITTFKPALHGVEILFLLRQPQLSDVAKYFKPLIAAAQAEKVKHIVFLSVQGVENSRIIPHYKIEKLIRESGIPYTFLRPAYFMQNFTTTLQPDLTKHNKIYLPAGKAKFTLIDTHDIGEVAAEILSRPADHRNKTYDLTNGEKLNFLEMAAKLSKGLGRNISYQSPNLMQFFLVKSRENVPVMYILVLIMLHYLPRFQKEPALTDWVQKITSRQPLTFDQFVQQNKAKLS